MSARAYRCAVTPPSGDAVDVSHLLEIGDMGAVSWEPETDLAVMAHGDLSLSFRTNTGEVEALLSNAQPGDLYEVILEGEMPDGTGWERIFGGVMDVPYSLVYDDKALKASVQCYSFSKLLERNSAEPIKRTLATKTASITAATRTLVFLTGETADLVPGDVVRLLGSTGVSEEFTIDKITSTSQAITTRAANSTFSSALVSVLTQFHHDKTPAYLLGLVAAQCGLELDASDLSADVATFPVATPITLEGLNVTEVPASIVPTGSTVSVTYQAADETKRKISATPSTAWTDGATSNTPQGDWTPYLLSEPASIMASSLGGPLDQGASAWDHTNSHVFRIFTESTGSPTFLTRLHVYRDSTDLGQFHSIPDGESFLYQSIEYDPVNDRVWVSSYDSLGVRKFSWIPAAGGAYTSFDSTRSGRLRLCRLHNALILVDDVTTAMRFYDLTTFALVREIVFTGGAPIGWTIRAWDNWLVFLYEQNAITHVAIYDTTNWTFVAAYTLSPSVRTFRFLTVQTLASGRRVGVAFAGGEWFVLSLRYDGVVRYADFDGASCGAAASGLAIVTNSIVDVDNFKTLSLRHRLKLGTGEVIADLNAPFGQMRRQVSELYRASVSVKGKSPSGVDIFVIAGATGDSARRLEIESKLANTVGMAVATAVATFQFVGAVRSQFDVKVRVTAPLRFGDRVSSGGKNLFAYKGSRDIERDLYDLTLLEVVA